MDVRLHTLLLPTVLLTVLLGLTAALCGCNTVRGAAEDIRSGFEPAPTPGKPIAFQGEPEIKIRIHRGVSKTRIDGSTSVVVRAVAGGRSESYVSPLVVESGSAGLKLTDGRGQVKNWPFGADIEVLAGDAGRGTVAPRLNQSMRIDGARHPGFAIIRPRWSDAPTQFDVIVAMPVESYLPGVLVGEVPRDWPRQSFEAQAVAARTYALHERERARRENRPFDVEATTSDQVYTGTVTVPAAVEAANATRGIVLLHRGSLLRAYFSSTCGGRPSSAAAVWPTDTGYEFNLAEPLQGNVRPAPCQDSKYYRWNIERDVEELSQRLRLWGRANKHEIAEVSRIRKIEVEDRNDALRPTIYRVTDSGDRTIRLKAEEIRMAANQAGGGLPPVTDANRVLSGDFEADIWATRVRFRGRGWGHGVGMCQYCAKQFAEDGKDWRSMMTLFYPGAEIKKVY